MALPHRRPLIRSQRMATPVKFGTEFNVNTALPFSQFTPAIGGLATGRFVASWTDGISQDVRARLFNADGSAIADDFGIATTTAGDQRDPAIATLPGGGFFIAWSSAGGEI